MELNKEILRDYVLVVAKEDFDVNEDLFNKIIEYDYNTFMTILVNRVNCLEKAMDDREKMWDIDPDYYARTIFTIKDIIKSLKDII